MRDEALVAAAQASLVTVDYPFTNPENLPLPERDHEPLTVELALRCALHNLQHAQSVGELTFYGLAALEYLRPVVALLNCKETDHA